MGICFILIHIFSLSVPASLHVLFIVLFDTSLMTKVLLATEAQMVQFVSERQWRWFPAGHSFGLSE